MKTDINQNLNEAYQVIDGAREQMKQASHSLWDLQHELYRKAAEVDGVEVKEGEELDLFYLPSEGNPYSEIIRALGKKITLLAEARR